MSKTKNILKDKLLDLKSFAKDGRKQAFFALFLVISLGIIFIVYADNNQDFTVNISDLQITTGDGTDVTSSSNPNVNSYDSIIYKMNYSMVQTNENLPTTGISEKKLIINVEIPKSSGYSTVKVNNGSIIEPTSDDNNYYYQASLSDIQLLATYTDLTISIENISPTSLIKPKITIKEENSSTITTISDKTFNVISTESKDFGLYVGGAIKTNENITVPVGVIVYMDNNLIGKKAPTNVNYKLSVKVNDIEQTISNPMTYNTNSEYKVNNMPYTLLTDEESGLSYEVNDNQITANNIKFNEKNTFNDKYLLLSTVIPITFDNNNEDTSIKISLNDGEKIIEYTLYKNVVIGDLDSNIKLFSNDKEQSVFNIDEQFNIKTTLSYSNNNSYEADSLSNAVTYLKVNNDAIKIINSEDNIPVKISDEKGNTVDATITYGVGSLDTNNFKIKTDAPQGCPTSITNSDDIIRLYGGPCIEGTSNLEWKSTLLNGENVNNISIIKIEFGKIDPNTILNISVNAKIKNTKDDSIVLGNIANKEFNIYSTTLTTINNTTYYLNSNSIITDNTESVSSSTNTMINGPFTSSKLKVSILRTTVAVQSYDLNDNKRDSFTLGLNDPIKWKINVNTLLSAEYSGTDASINLNLIIKVPLNLNVQSIKDYVDLGNYELIDGLKVYNVNFSQVSTGITTIEFVTGISELITSEEEATITVIANSSLLINDNTISSGNEESSRTDSHKVELHNNNKISLLGQTDKHYFDQNTSYTYNMKAYNNSITAGTSKLISVLPYSTYSGSYNVTINNLLDGYKAYYTEIDSPENIYTNEVNNPTLNNWQEWTNLVEAKKGITGIKIESTSSFNQKTYFMNSDGINITILPENNKRGDIYTNSFAIIDSSNNIYKSQNSEVSVYDRKISGFVFDDNNYNGQYDDEEKNIVDLDVELYKINLEEDYDINQTPLYIGENDEKIDSTTTDTDGSYSFSGLEEGIYYTKIKFDSEQYTVTSYQIENSSVDNISSINSKYLMVPNTDYAVSKLLVLNDNNLKSSNINLGLRTRQIFDIAIKKYITNVKVIKNNKEENYNYDNSKQVKIDVKNLKNSTVEVTYGFELYNTKYFPGYVGDIVESIPYGMIFDSSKKENSLWEGNNEYLHYKGLDNLLIMPGKKYHFKIILTVDGENAGNYINVVSAGNLKMMDILQ